MLPPGAELLLAGQGQSIEFLLAGTTKGAFALAPGRRIKIRFATRLSVSQHFERQKSVPEGRIAPGERNHPCLSAAFNYCCLPVSS
jgi:hypothetical protein